MGPGPNYQQPQPQVHVPPSHIQMGNNTMIQMSNSWGPSPQPLPAAIINAPIPPNVSAQIESINNQRLTLLDQIRQSELNLSAQKELMQQQQDSQMDEIIAKIQTDAIAAQAEEKNIRLMEFDTILQPIMDSCTKDSISAGMCTN